jgi:hypothetical protein
MAAAIAATACLVPASGAKADNPHPDPVRLRQAKEFRASFGLTTDESVITSAEANSALSRKYGVALTATEAAQIDGRVDMSQKLDPLEKQLRLNPDYVDLYIDQAAGGIIDVATTGDPADLASSLARYGPKGARFRSHHVDYSMAYLTALQQQVEADLLGSPAQGTEIASIGVDVTTNRLKIGVVAPTPATMSYLSDRYGPAIEVASEQPPLPAKCTSQQDCVPPVKGGIEIGLAADLDGEGRCSSAYSARTASGEVVLVTAGHCAGSPNRRVYNGQGPFNERIGSIAGSTMWTDVSGPDTTVSADGAYITLSPGMTGSNLVYLSPDNYGHIVGVIASSSTHVGDVVCKEGRTTGLTCGKITALDQTFGMSDTRYTVQHQTDTDVSTDFGDSGGVFFQRSTVPDHLILYGVVSQAGGIFSPADRVDAALGLTPCLTDCGATYTPLMPTRVLDTRPASHIGDATTLHSQVKQTFSVTGAGIPWNAVAITGNVTVTGQTALGYVTVAPSLTSYVAPSTSTLNFPVGDDRANGITVPLSPDRKLDVMYWASSTSATANVIVDATGFYTNTWAGATYTPLTPRRVLDTRPSSHVGDASTLVARTKQSFSVGMPSGAAAVTGNLTVTRSTARGFVTLVPGLTSGVIPATSTINFPAGDDRANGVTVPLSSDGKLDVMYWASAGATTDVTFDVTGYYMYNTAGLTYHALDPTRVLDTRPASHVGNAWTLVSRTKQQFSVAPYVGELFNVAGQSAVAGNLTVTGQTALGFVTVAPSLVNGQAPPTSTINFPPGDNRANNVTVELSSIETLDAMYWASGTIPTTNIVFDVTCYFSR